MQRLAEIIRGISVLLSDVALACLMLMLVPLLLHRQVPAGYGVWLLYLAVQFLVSYGMLAAGTGMNLYLTVSAAMIGAGTFFTCRAFSGLLAVAGSTGMEGLLWCIGICAAATGVHGAWMAYRLPGANGILRYVDCLAAAIAFYLYTAYETGEAGDQALLGISLAAVFLDLFAVNQLRTGEECPSVIQGAGSGGKLLLGLIFLLCLAVTGGIVGLASGQVHSLVDVLLVILAGIWRILSAVLEAFALVLGYVILFVLALLPNAPAAAQEKAAAMVWEGADAVAESAGALLPAWVWQVLLAAGLAAGIGAVFYGFRHVKLRRTVVRKKTRRVVRKSHFWESVGRLAGQVRDWLWFQWSYLRCRRTPQGLFILAERTGRRLHMKRRMAESPGAYVRRLAAVQAASSDFSLEELARMLDGAFYGGQDIRLTAEEYAGYRRQVKYLADKKN